ncbi:MULTISPECIES: TolC family protein [unclassified Nitratiruptor]|uniref:TolC family protein n=1 Tax=unclassified Nitratiruptor TaxID=2624044 RepID=UPI0019151F91|nr:MULTISPECIES: TolC family protein [unclassified Nitratiruptor]BCD60707.1 outer membrane protein [Nitratiruptor sp. YY08-10]BCD64640.1 outer membrane protein [Nitratiruptor sp. YY08-14]
MRISLLLLFLIAFTWAETLEDVALKATQHNFKLKSLEHSIKASKYRKKGAYSNLFPSINASGSYGKDKYHYEYPTRKINYDSTVTSYTISVKQPVYEPKIYAMIHETKLKEKYASVQKEAFTNDLLQEITNTYIEVVSLRSLIALAQKKSFNYQKMVRDIKKKMDLHLAAKSDYLYAVAKYEQAKSDVAQFRLALQNQLQKLSFLANDAVTEISFSAISDSVLNIKLPDIDIANNPELMLYALNTKIAKNEVQKRKYGRYPSLDLALSYGDTVSDDSITRRGNSRAFLELTLPIFNAALNNSIKEAIELYNAAKYDYLDRKNSFSIQKEKSATNIKSYQKLLEADNQSIQSYAIYLQKAKLSYENRLISVIDLYKAQNDYYDAVIQKIKHKKALLQEFVNYLSVGGKLDMHEVVMIQFLYLKKRSVYGDSHD